MRTLLVTLAVVLALGLAYAATHLALIEVGQEIVVLHKPRAGGDPKPARLWIVDGEGGTWLHHGDADSYWIRRLETDPIVTIERAGEAREYRATPDPAADPVVHRLMRAKYGVADRLVRFWAGTDSATGFATRRRCEAIPVRLEPR